MDRIEEARKAFERGDWAAAREAHRRHAAAEPHPDGGVGTYLGEWVYGASDGIVTTFAVVAGVAGAALSPTIVLILGMANLLADGLSMAAGAFLSERSRQDFERREREREMWEVEHFPDEEREEIRQIYRAKGFEGEDLERAVAIITADRARWVETMMREELQILPERKDPFRAGFATFAAFVVAGAVPLIAYIGAGYLTGLSASRFAYAVAVTLLTLFGVGSLRALVIHKTWWRAGFEMLFVGGLAAAVAYGVGYLLRGVM